MQVFLYLSVIFQKLKVYIMYGKVLNVLITKWVIFHIEHYTVK